MKLVQVNLQPHFGGGEVYTAFLCRALSALGVSTRLLVHPRAAFWDRLGLPADTERIVASDPANLLRHLPQGPLWLLAHGPLPDILRREVPGRWRSAIAHMPVQGRNPEAFAAHDRIYAVSGWVRDGLLAAGLPAWEQPLYGVAEVGSRGGEREVRRRSRYDWDRRKGRDRLFGALEPLAEALRQHPPFVRRDGLSLGIVSRLTPIKQFPSLFAHLAAELARRPRVNLEIFGSGGYASVRDLDHALAALPRGQVRFWGQQNNVAGIYRQLDYLLSGLPEKEALGLNIIEAQACGTPVIAVDAPPFTETVVHGATGFLYPDPRTDGGAGFGSLLDELLAGRPRPKPELAHAHLARFSFEAFVERLRPVLADVEQALRAA
ncbi:MAG: glycosyltransferase [Burkholderiaceae bacterium]|nr:glycosyltransferase [Sulfuritalea sp.]MCF8176689.1 glycosyltransferase [Burkholderiaceae bacterium]